MAITNINNIGRSQTISDIKPTITAEHIPTHSSLISTIAFVVTAATIAISPTVQNISGTIGPLVTADYPKTTTVTEILPFRLTITNIGIEGYRADNPPGIGVQIIGFSNYIL
jgi:hypothetical protein